MAWSTLGSLFQNDNRSSKYNDILAQHATLHYMLNEKKNRINEQKLTGWRFLRHYKGKAWIL